MSPRQQLIDILATVVDSQGYTRVAVDGVDGAGKTHFADELAGALTAMGRPVIRVGVDSYLHPPEIRHRRGRHSPEGFFLDSFDYDRLKREVLDSRDDRILVFDGIFAHRPELASYWDFSIFLRVGFDVSISRWAVRDGISPDPHAESNRRYVEGQRIYLRSCRPEERASIVIDNENLSAPSVVAGRLPGMYGQSKAATPEEYIEALDEPRRSDLRGLHELIRSATPELEPTMEFGMPGYGKYHYRYATGREGDWILVGMASNKNYISLYVTAMTEDGQYLAETYRSRLPKASIGRSCIRFKRLSDVDTEVLADLLRTAAAGHSGTLTG